MAMTDELLSNITPQAGIILMGVASVLLALVLLWLFDS
jgi:hypothetical protein